MIGLLVFGLYFFIFEWHWLFALMIAIGVDLLFQALS